MEDSNVGFTDDTTSDTGVRNNLAELQYLLSKPRNQRSTESLSKIYSHLMEYSFFGSLDQVSRHKLCDFVNFYEVKSGQQIQKGGSKADKVFVLLRGSCRVELFGKIIDINNEASTLYGATACLDDTAFTESVFANQDSVGLHIEKKHFVECLREFFRRQKCKVQQALRQLQVFSKFDDDKIARISLYCNIRFAPRGEFLISEGSLASSMIFILDGAIEVLKIVDEKTLASVAVAKLTAGVFYGASNVLKQKLVQTHSYSLYAPQDSYYLEIKQTCFHPAVSIQGVMDMLREVAEIDELRLKRWQENGTLHHRLVQDAREREAESIDSWHNKTKRKLQSIIEKNIPIMEKAPVKKSIAHQNWVFSMKPRRIKRPLSLRGKLPLAKNGTFDHIYEGEAKRCWERQKRLHLKKLIYGARHDQNKLNKAKVLKLTRGGKLLFDDAECVPVRHSVSSSQAIDDLLISTEMELSLLNEKVRRREKDQRSRSEKLPRSPVFVEKAKKIQALVTKKRANKRSSKTMHTSIENLNEMPMLKPKIPVMLHELNEHKLGSRKMTSHKAIALLQAAMKNADDEKKVLIGGKEGKEIKMRNEAKAAFQRRIAVQSPHESKDPTLLRSFTAAMARGLDD